MHTHLKPFSIIKLSPGKLSLRSKLRIPGGQNPGPWVQPTRVALAVRTWFSMEKCRWSNTVITGLSSDVVGNTQGPGGCCHFKSFVVARLAGVSDAAG